MDTLLYAVLSNAAVVVVLVPLVSLFGRCSRRPALVHSLWLIIFLKLLTPPLWPVVVSWPVRAEEVPATTDVLVWQPGPSPEPVAAVLSPALTEKGTALAAEETQAQADSVDTLQDQAVPACEPAQGAWLLPTGKTLRPADVAAPPAWSWRSGLVTVWLAGSVGWLALVCRRLCRFQRLLRLTQRAPLSLQNRAQRLAARLGLRRCPGVWIVSAPISPLVWALVGEPRLLLPASLLERLSEEQGETLLAHELAHLRRRDHWVRLVELAVLGLYWWHPAVWWARRQLRQAEEQCCDAWVVWALPDAAELYARTLVEALTYLSGARYLLPLAASGIGHMQLLKRRLTMIMHGTTPRALSAAGSLAVLGLAAVLLPLAPTWARTEQRREHAEAQPPPGGAGAAGSLAAPAAADAAATLPRTTLGAAPASGSAADTAGAPPGGVQPDRSEAVEDVQDEVDLLRVQLALRRAERREVAARLHQARRDAQKYERLAANRAINSSEREHAETEVEVQEARLAAKDAQIQEAELRLKQAERRLAKLQGRIAALPRPLKPYPPGSPPRPLEGGSALGPAPFGSPRGPLGFPPHAKIDFPFPAKSAAPPGSYEHRLAEVEKKLQSLIEEMKALRKGHLPEKREADKK